MKILMTTDTVGGVWTYAIELSAELARQGVQVALATMGDPPRTQQRREAHAISGLNLFESTYRLEWMDDPWEDVKQAGEWLQYLEEVIRPHIIHLNGYAHAALPFKAPTVVAAHSCLLTWHQAVKGTPVPDSLQTYATVVKRGLTAAGTVVAPTRAMLQALTAAYGPLPRSVVIPNARHMPRLETVAKWPFILCAGRLWDEAKNVALLEEAAPRLSWPVWLAGEVTLIQSRQRHYRNNINLLGQLPFAELAHWYQRAAIYCLPAKYEPFGLTALEAALSGCALVLGDIESLREVWGDAAIYVRPDDRDGLVAALQELIDKPDYLAAQCSVARERAARYAPDKMGSAYAGLYRRLAEPVRERAETPAAAYAM